MNILLYYDILNTCLSFKDFSNKKKLYDIIYNKSNTISFTQNYISLLEKSILNKELLDAFIHELIDTDRIIIEKTKPQSSINEEFVEIAKACKDSTLLPIVHFDSENFKKNTPCLLIVSDATPINNHWIKLELLTNNACSVCYKNFKNDSEIITFFDNVFSIPKYIREVSIFNRDITTSFLTKLKSCNIKYYTLQSKEWGHITKLKESKKDLQKTLGGKLKLFYTGNPRKIHERKIIFDDIVITIDNAHINLTVEEPTWEIIITQDKNKAIFWKEKCDSFVEVLD